MLAFISVMIGLALIDASEGGSSQSVQGNEQVLPSDDVDGDGVSDATQDAGSTADDIDGDGIPNTQDDDASGDGITEDDLNAVRDDDGDGRHE